MLSSGFDSQHQMGMVMKQMVVQENLPKEQTGRNFREALVCPSSHSTDGKIGLG